MSSATDDDLRKQAEALLAEAFGALGLPAVVVGADVSGDDYWARFLERARNAWDKAKKYTPLEQGAEAARKIRDAARKGTDKASTAADDIKRALAALAAAAGAFSLGPLILPGLIVFLIIESTGYGKRARAGARRYVDQRAKSYGF